MKLRLSLAKIMRCKTGARGYMFKLIFSNYLLTTIFFSHRIYRGARFPENRWNFAIRVWVGWGGGGRPNFIISRQNFVFTYTLKIVCLDFYMSPEKASSKYHRAGKKSRPEDNQNGHLLMHRGTKNYAWSKKKFDGETGLDKGE